MSKLVFLSEAASIGIHTMVMIARSEEIITTNTLAERTGSSRHHIAKILQRLAKDQLLTSNRGPSGGFVLNKPAKKISLLNIYESIEGKVEVTACPIDNPVCPFDKCLLGSVLPKVITDLRDYLASQTLDKYL